MTTATKPTFTDVTAADIDAAAARLAGVAVRTLLIELMELSQRTGLAAALKPESLQRTGSFKFRGAYNFIASLDADTRARGVVAPSSGNHGQAVACVASLFGIPATIVMPTTVTEIKKRGVERWGATSVLAGTTTDDRANEADRIAHESGATIVPPYDHPWIIAGQATVGGEVVEQAPDVDTVIVPVGGGGLSAGVSTIVRARRPDARIVVVEPEGAPKLTAAWKAGQPVDVTGNKSAADGLLAVRIGAMNYRALRAHADDVVTVTEDEIRDAAAYLFQETKLVAEPSGATSVAGLLSGRVAARGRTVAIISGGNVALDALARFVAG